MENVKNVNVTEVENKIVIKNAFLRGAAKTGIFIGQCALAALIGYTVGKTLDSLTKEK